MIYTSSITDDVLALGIVFVIITASFLWVICYFINNYLIKKSKLPPELMDKVKEAFLCALSDDADNTAKCPKCGLPCCTVTNKGVWAGRIFLMAHMPGTGPASDPEYRFACVQCWHGFRIDETKGDAQ